MAGLEENIEIKFRIFDGTDIAHRTYAISTTVASLKQMLVAEWPQDVSVAPKSANELKLIHGGRVLESSKTLSEYRIHLTDVSGGVITMHVVVQPPIDKKKSEKNKEVTTQISCSCTIL
ncbi:membrane-anchored ubiquitin-fold protein 3-like [Impatiens glandulifera]|uniref:membrane-anchored ubiquitin-fold protein 3-like n=1 Tax=Impatiens glandulifera TaxID=253017 RepID=UPI001FB06CA0|nr:membrane-anchored ubiquitin-fold protein 3-like [Impatiens glandulifera]XP_047312750.1 membrane-anchored ubiquitin-fold protein 3-like [Impatiens glandulifera]XP_047312755.1 membrane-anchored ubiquitin-fold protein 3-like [Impatiens glandulifera]